MTIMSIENKVKAFFMRLKRDGNCSFMACLLNLNGYMIQKVLYILIALFVLPSCTESSFTKTPGPNCQGFLEDCESVDGLDVFDYEVEIQDEALNVDLLFVVDNSSSMAREQASMADRFPTFISSISDLNWRIGIVTTDMSSDTGETKGGNLLPFSSGQYFIDKTFRNAENLFKNTVKRPETGSGDERGIYAAIKAIEKRMARPFIRESAKHLGVIILSDESERSSGGQHQNYPLESGKDYGQDLINTVNGTWSFEKTLTVHSIVIQNEDSSCLQEQRQQGNGRNGYYDTIYSDLARRTGGIVGDICASDYGSQLEDIGDVTVQNTGSLQLACRPADDEVEVSITRGSQNVTSIVSGDKIVFNPPLSPGTRVRLTYSCFQ